MKNAYWGKVVLSFLSENIDANQVLVQLIGKLAERKGRTDKEY